MISDISGDFLKLQQVFVKTFNEVKTNISFSYGGIGWAIAQPPHMISKGQTIFQNVRSALSRITLNFWDLDIADG